MASTSTIQSDNIVPQLLDLLAHLTNDNSILGDLCECNKSEYEIKAKKSKCISEQTEAKYETEVSELRDQIKSQEDKISLLGNQLSIFKKQANALITKNSDTIKHFKNLECHSREIDKLKQQIDQSTLIDSLKKEIAKKETTNNEQSKIRICIGTKT